MERLQKAVRPGYTEETLQAWEEMRVEILHEIQDGGSVREDQMEAASDVAAHLYPWPQTLPALVHPASVPRRYLILPDQMRGGHP
jgi:hypothetical protein